MKCITTTLDELELGPPASFRNLSVFPLLGRRREKGETASYLTLDEALAEGCATVREIGRGGQVPQLELVNEGERPVLLLDGEELTGAKQNRVLNLTILAPGKQTIVIPVSCVEAGRWAFRGGMEFAASPQVMYQSARSSKLRQVSLSMLRAGSRRSDQGAVWRDIDCMAEVLGSKSPTAEMGEMFRQHAGSIEDYVRAIPHVADQVGGVFAIDGSVRGLELLDHTETMRKLLPKLVRSYALDAIGSRVDLRQPPEKETVEAFVSEVGRAEVRSMPALGLGEDLRLSGPGIAGGALVVDDEVVHLSAFRFDDAGDGGGGGFRRGMASLAERMRRRRGN